MEIAPEKLDTINEKGRPTRNVPRISFSEEEKLPRLPKKTKKRKADVKLASLDNEVESKKAKVAVAQGANSNQAEVVLWKTLKDQKQDELEEIVIANAFAKPSNSAKKSKPQAHPEDFPSQQAAQTYCLSDPTLICPDMSLPGAELVGQLAKVYWDGEDTWFYARVLNFNPSSGEYFVYYFEDSTGEWMDFNNESVIVSKQLVLTRTSKTAILWPAMTFHTFPKAREVLRRYPAYSTNGEYVEFLHGDGRYEYAFVQQGLIEPYEFGFLPKKPNKKLQSAVEEAVKQKEAYELVVQQVQAAIGKSVLTLRTREKLVGTRVRAATSRILTRAERKMKPEERLNIVSAFCVGTVTQYCPSKDMHLISFDDAHLQPQWMEIAKAHAQRQVEILLSTQTNTTMVTTTITSSIDASEHDESMTGKEATEHTEEKEGEQDEALPLCHLCTHDCDDEEYGQGILKCHRCQVVCHEHCLPAGELIPVNAAARLKASQWLCWRCTDCFNCASTSWHTPLIYWSSKNHVPRQTDSRTLLLCGWCLKHYKHSKEYCVVCYKLYVYQQHQIDANAESSAIEASYNSDLTMVQCHQCDRWVHATCEGIDEQQYQSISEGTHPIWGDEYLCPLCRVQLCRDVMKRLFALDVGGIFSVPVTEDIAANYFDIIHNPMDFSTMLEKVERGMYKSLQPLRQDAELVALNALLFNRSGDPIWKAAQLLFIKVSELFLRMPRHSTRSAYGREVEQIIQAKHLALTGQLLQLPPASSVVSDSIVDSSIVDSTQKKAKGKGKKSDYAKSLTSKLSSEDGQTEEKRLNEQDETLSEEDAQSDDDSDDALEYEQDEVDVSQLAVAVMQKLALESSPEPESFLPPRINAVSAEEAKELCSEDCCFSCGASSEVESFLCCCDCGEAVHYFCAGINEAQFASMDKRTRNGWRCVNCKVCEICVQSFPTDAQTLLFCEQCDRSFHLSCLRPTIAELPDFTFICGHCLSCDLCDTLGHLHSKDSDVSRTGAQRIWGNCTNLCVNCQDVISAATAPSSDVSDTRSLLANLKHEYPPSSTSDLSGNSNNTMFKKEKLLVMSPSPQTSNPIPQTDEARRFLTSWTIACATTHLFYLRHYGSITGDLSKLLPSVIPVKPVALKGTKGSKRAAIVDETKATSTANVVVKKEAINTENAEEKDEEDKNNVDVDEDIEEKKEESQGSTKPDSLLAASAAEAEDAVAKAETKRLSICRARRFSALTRRRVHARQTVTPLTDGQQLHVNALSQVSSDGMDRIARSSASFTECNKNADAGSICTLLEILETLLALLQTALGLYARDISPEMRQRTVDIHQLLDNHIRQNYVHISSRILDAKKARENMLSELQAVVSESCTVELLHVMQVVARHVAICQINAQQQQQNPSATPVPTVEVDKDTAMNVLTTIFPGTFRELCELSSLVSSVPIEQQAAVRQRKSVLMLLATTKDALLARNHFTSDLHTIARIPKGNYGKKVVDNTVPAMVSINIPLLRYERHQRRLRKPRRFDLTTWRYLPAISPIIDNADSKMSLEPGVQSSLTVGQKGYLDALFTAKQAALSLLQQPRYQQTSSTSENSSMDVVVTSKDEETVNMSEVLVSDVARFDALVRDLQHNLPLSTDDALQASDLSKIDDIKENSSLMMMQVDDKTDEYCEGEEEEKNSLAFAQRCCLCGTSPSDSSSDNYTCSDNMSSTEKRLQQWEREKGRLLPMGDTRHVHVNCLRWCEEVRESVPGVLHHSVSAVDINLKVRCVFCQQPGASLLCMAQRRCRNAYHLTCARAMDCLLLQRRSTRSVSNSTTTVGNSSTVSNELIDDGVTGAVDSNVEDDGQLGLCLLCPQHIDLCPSLVLTATNNSTNPTTSYSVTTHQQRSKLEAGIEQQLLRHKHDLWKYDERQDKKRIILQYDLDISDQEDSDDDNQANNTVRNKDNKTKLTPTTTTTTTTVDAQSNKGTNSNSKAAGSKDMRTKLPNKKKSASTVAVDAEDEVQRRMAQLLVDRRLRADQALRLGALTVHRLGQLVVNDPAAVTDTLALASVSVTGLPTGHGFVTRDYLYPLHYCASRVFWSYTQPQQRTVYQCSILCLDDLASIIDNHLLTQTQTQTQTHISVLESMSPLQLEQRRNALFADIFQQLFGNNNTTTHRRNDSSWDKEAVAQFDGPIFCISAADDAEHAIYSTSLVDAHHRLLLRLQKHHHSLIRGMTDEQRRLVYGLSAHQFFGLGVSVVRRALELCPEALSAMLPLPHQLLPKTPSFTQTQSQNNGQQQGAKQELASSFAAETDMMVTTDVSSATIMPPQPQQSCYRPTYCLPSHSEMLRLERRRRRLVAQQTQSLLTQNLRLRSCSRAQSLRPPRAKTNGSSNSVGTKKVRTKVADVDDNDEEEDDDENDTNATNIGNKSNIKTKKSNGKKRGLKENTTSAADSESDADEAEDKDELQLADDEDHLDAERRARQKEEEELEKEAAVDERKQRYLNMRHLFQLQPNAGLRVRRSGIHGWGLFSKKPLDKDAVIVEYVGEQIRQAVADRRELLYEEEGVGSCYLFRLDKEIIVDATRSGGMARFINHSCDPNAYARIISANTNNNNTHANDNNMDSGNNSSSNKQEAGEEEKHIVIMALREIQPGEEITYDYKFPIEDKKLRCYCGSARCSGAMN